jgi:hypothetical protein
LVLHRLITIIITIMATDPLLGRHHSSQTKSMPNTELLDDLSIAAKRAI